MEYGGLGVEFLCSRGISKVKMHFAVRGRCRWSRAMDLLSPEGGKQQRKMALQEGWAASS